jgi:KipI family sensor histidine kinase inhibitor
MHSEPAGDVSLTAVGEAGMLVFFANRISPKINARVHALRRAIIGSATPGLVDLVPAYASLLVTFDPDRLSHEALSALVIDIVSAPSQNTNTRLETGASHIVPVRFGGENGPDLDETATLNNISPEDLIKWHTGRSYRAYFLGFQPGFAYLGKLPAELAAPRLATPRTRVPAGSVGLAGAQTAVYPFSSPGGWRIIGRTSLSVWDPFSPEPARIAPGDTVRFVPSAVEPAREQAGQPAAIPAVPALECRAAPGLTTIQDLGRSGLAHLGVAQGGAFDEAAAIRANALVGNERDAAVLEMTWTGPDLTALRNVIIALDGADLGCRVDGARVPTGISWFVRRGSAIRFSHAGPGRGGMRGYLAVAGGFDVPLVLGSRSTNLQASFGGLAGSPLRGGELLGIGGPRRGHGADMPAGRYLLGPVAELLRTQLQLRYLAYRGRGEALATARALLAMKSFRLSEQADRMGYRFRAEDWVPLPTSSGELISFGVVRGAIQLPPDGSPLLLNVDHQTTGGYPLLGVVIRADWPLVAQLAPGATVRFKEVTVDEATAARRIAEEELRRGLRGLSTPD